MLFNTGISNIERIGALNPLILYKLQKFRLLEVKNQNRGDKNMTANDDNHANQCNPNNDEYHHSREEPEDDE